MSREWIRRAGATGLVLVFAILGARPAVAQRADPPTVQFSPLAGISIQEGTGGLRVAEDVLSYGLRVTFPWSGYQPWLEVLGFTRPDLECLPSLPCNDGGWIARIGTEAIIASNPFRPGVSPRVLVGVGAAVSEETSFSYLLGAGLEWRLGAVFSTFSDLRWEGLPGIDLIMITAGIRIDVP